MPARLRAACPLVFILAARAVAAVAPADPGEVKEFDPSDGSSIFGLRRPAGEYRGPLAACSVCGAPLKDHLDPGFVCRAPGQRVESVDTRRALCPVCANGFEAPVPESDPGGSLDRDFCRHHRGTLARATNVWMCPKCGYSAFHWDFDRAVDEETRAFVGEAVTPATVAILRQHAGMRPDQDRRKKMKSKEWQEFLKLEDFSFLKQTSLPEFLKYENALAIGLRRGASHRELARLYLEASHAYRRLVSAPVAASGLDGAIRKVERLMAEPLGGSEEPAELARAGLRLLTRADVADAAKAEKLTDRSRLLVCVRMAGLHDRLGEVWWSCRYLQEAEELAARETDERTRPMLMGLVRRRADELKREAYHQARAAEHFKRALAAGNIPAGERLLTVYLVGELLTRTGEIAKAVPWFEAALVLAEGTEAAAPTGDEQATSSGPRFDRPDRAFRLSGLASGRLESPAFAGGGQERVAADAEEEAFVADLLVRWPGGETPAARVAAPAAGQRGQRPPDGVVDPTSATSQATGPRRPDNVVDPAGPEQERELSPVGTVSEGRPASCREQLAGVWRAVEAYRDARGEFPPDLEALVGAGLLTREAAGDIVCVESGNRLFYRRPQPGAGATFIIFHKNPTTCTCRNVLYSDGSVRELGK
jgi:tetratricopeptide (TPR) repeat protein